MEIEDIEKMEMGAVEIDPKQLIKIAKLVTDLQSFMREHDGGYLNPREVTELILRVSGIDCQICQLLKDVLLDRIVSTSMLMEVLNFDKLNLEDKGKDIL